MMRKSDRDCLNDHTGSLTNQLRAKSRRRRKELVRMPSPDLSRNDLMPSLALIYLPLGELRVATRKVRKIDPANGQRQARRRNQG
jgi:hypothetical protein